MSSLIRRLQRKMKPRSGDEQAPRTSRRVRKREAVVVGACSRLDRDSWAAASSAERREYHRERMLSRRARQLKPARSRVWRSDSIASANRRGGEHQDNREIERRRRQAERKARKAGGG